MMGGRTQYHEDPIEGGTTFRRVDMQKFRSIRGAQFEKDRERMNNGGRQKQKCNMGSSALFIGVNNYLSAEFSQLATRCNVRQTKCSPAAIFAVWFGLFAFLAKADYLVLGFSFPSARKILTLGTSKTLCKHDPLSRTLLVHGSTPHM